ncbi:M18 family aminopeptidase [Clostridium sp. D2Q-14]|uniref:M18 family aminopeptidase n=1 Tax=Anaeromonas gelatinilytica TaxID=2683194 RepID=UPI00193C42DC|nr:M18 family aminopeptidase [Anaeromonas gelatinilytica]MBS4536565.1 M18 family aminopeptidase [Anaeromonas gelatinilytica]
MTKELNFAKNLLDFIYDSPTQFHTVEKVKSILLEKGFSELKLNERWNIEKGKKYFTTKNDSALVAFKAGSGDIEAEGFKIIGAHTDAPTFRIKPNPEMIEGNAYLRLNTEVYGGPILNTWLDRPLSIAGRVTIKSDNILKPKSKLLNINRPVLVIPNLAIHMNKEVNKGIELNKQKHTLPLVSLINEEFEKDNYLINIIADELNINSENIIDFDLFLYEYNKGNIIGMNDEFISTGKLDDLAMVHAGINALIESPITKGTNVMVCFDNEEIGSRTKQGAASPMLKDILERIVLAYNKDRESFMMSLYNSFIISADMAHALHPNYLEKHDPTNKPVLDGGPVIKINANQSYTTDCDSGAVYEIICKNAGIPYQKFVNRSDERGGSTIGPISSSQLDIRSIDIGGPMLGMHSIRELCSVKDHYYMKKSFDEFYKL